MTMPTIAPIDSLFCPEGAVGVGVLVGGATVEKVGGVCPCVGVLRMVVTGLGVGMGDTVLDTVVVNVIVVAGEVEDIGGSCRALAIFDKEIARTTSEQVEELPIPELELQIASSASWLAMIACFSAFSERSLAICEALNDLIAHTPNISAVTKVMNCSPPVITFFSVNISFIRRRLECNPEGEVGSIEGMCWMISVQW